MIFCRGSARTHEATYVPFGGAEGSKNYHDNEKDELDVHTLRKKRLDHPVDPRRIDAADGLNHREHEGVVAKRSLRVPRLPRPPVEGTFFVQAQSTPRRVHRIGKPGLACIRPAGKARKKQHGVCVHAHACKCTGTRARGRPVATVDGAGADGARGATGRERSMYTYARICAKAYVHASTVHVRVCLCMCRCARKRCQQSAYTYQCVHLPVECVLRPVQVVPAQSEERLVPRFGACRVRRTDMALEPSADLCGEQRRRHAYNTARLSRDARLVLLHRVTASITYGYSLYYLRLQPLTQHAGARH